MAKVVDKAMWSAGPIFIGLAIFLLDMCVLGYYLVVFPYHHPWKEQNGFGHLVAVLNLLFTIYIVYAVHFHYWMAVKTPPGDMEEHRKSDSDEV
jgi:palmitoyltransferase